MVASGKNEIITIRGLNKTFGSGDTAVTALSGIDLTIYEGEIFGIIGLSGAGKSTLVRCMNYLEKPTDGSVVIAGQALEKLQPGELLAARRSMGMIFQQFNLLMQKNAIQNICFPLEIAGVPKAQAVKRARELLEVVELQDKEKAYPAQLSHGHLWRVKSGYDAAIAEARRSGVDILLFGHTHKACCQQLEDGLWVVNPGASRSSYGTILLDGGSISCTLTQLI